MADKQLTMVPIQTKFGTSSRPRIPQGYGMAHGTRTLSSGFTGDDGFSWTQSLQNTTSGYAQNPQGSNPLVSSNLTSKAWSMLHVGYDLNNAILRGVTGFSCRIAATTDGKNGLSVNSVGGVWVSNGGYRYVYKLTRIGGNSSNTGYMSYDLTSSSSYRDSAFSKRFAGIIIGWSSNGNGTSNSNIKLIVSDLIPLFPFTSDGGLYEYTTSYKEPIQAVIPVANGASSDLKLTT